MAEKKNNRQKYFSYGGRFAVAGIALYLAFRGEDLGEVKDILLGLNPLIFALAIGFYAVGQFLFVVRWRSLLSVQSIKIGFWPALRLHFLGLFYNNCLPGAIGGDLPRAWYVTKHTDKKLEAALSVFVDRMVGLTGMLLMAFFCYWFIPEEGRTEGMDFSFNLNPVDLIIKYKWIFTSAVVVIAAALLVLMSTQKGRDFLTRLRGVIRQHGVSIIVKVRNSIRIYCSKRLAILFALCLTFICQSLHVIGILLIGRELGIEAHPKYYFIFFPVSWLLGALPISVGGLGIMEGWLKIMFMRVGTISSKNALVLALCQRFILLITSLPGVVIHLIGAHLPKDFSVDGEK